MCGYSGTVESTKSFTGVFTKDLLDVSRDLWQKSLKVSSGYVTVVDKTIEVSKNSINTGNEAYSIVKNFLNNRAVQVVALVLLNDNYNSAIETIPGIVNAATNAAISAAKSVVPSVAMGIYNTCTDPTTLLSVTALGTGMYIGGKNLVKASESNGMIEKAKHGAKALAGFAIPVIANVAMNAVTSAATTVADAAVTAATAVANTPAAVADALTDPTTPLGDITSGAGMFIAARNLIKAEESSGNKTKAYYLGIGMLGLGIASIPLMRL